MLSHCKMTLKSCLVGHHNLVKEILLENNNYSNACLILSTNATIIKFRKCDFPFLDQENCLDFPLTILLTLSTKLLRSILKRTVTQRSRQLEFLTKLGKQLLI